MTAALELHVLPGMGKVPIGSLTAPLAIEFLDPIAKRGALETVRKLCRWIKPNRFGEETRVMRYWLEGEDLEKARKLAFGWRAAA